MDDKHAEYIPIRTKKDIAVFLDRTNGLHDGYVIGIHYEHMGHSGGNPHYINPDLSELRMRVMITSIHNAVVELCFQTISGWQIKDNTCEILDSAISFDDNGYIVWADDYTTDPVVRENGSYVVAKTMKWRFV